MTFDDAYDKLVGFRVRGFADKCKEIAEDPTLDGMGFLEKVALATEAEDIIRHDRCAEKRNKAARFSNPMACVEDIIYLPNRTLSKETVARLSGCEYIRNGHNVIVTSPTGAGKSYLVQALGNAACRRGHKVRYIRHADFCRDLNVARKTGDYYDHMEEFEDSHLLILDDLFLEDSDMKNVTDLLEVITHRADAKASIVIASQLMPEQWHLRIDTKIIADALLDRLVHNSYTIEIDGPNMREYCKSLA
ncbi:MAG: ATP-binding protein [Clostridiales bacterium]|nr:ATP-binding protein [Clostridiales bacterium]